MALVNLTGESQQASPAYACGNCGRTIGAMEQPYQWGQAVICPECCQHLQNQAANPPNALRQPPTRAALRELKYSDGRAIAGLVAALAMVIGAFCPIFSVPIFGSINYVNTDHGKIFLGISIVAGIIAITPAVKFGWFFGMAAMGLALFDVIRADDILTGIKEKAALDISMSPIASAMVDSMQLQWGWAVIFIGAGVMMANPAFRWRRN